MYVQSYRPNLFPVMKWAYTKKPRPSGKCKRITKSSSNSFLASWFYCYTNICTFDSAQKYNKKSGRPPNSELQIVFWSTYFLQAILWATMFNMYSTYSFGGFLLEISLLKLHNVIILCSFFSKTAPPILMKLCM